MSRKSRRRGGLPYWWTTIQVGGKSCCSRTPSSRSSAHEALHQLRHLNIQKTLILTGDHLNSAQEVAREVGIAEVHASLLPEEKLDRLEELSRQGYKVAMVGDGVNDSPALALAHVGVAMGDTGTDIAADAAGVVLMDEGSLDRLGYVIKKSRKTVKKMEHFVFGGV